MAKKKTEEMELVSRTSTESAAPKGLKEKLVYFASLRYPWLKKAMAEAAMTENIYQFVEKAMTKALALTIVLLLLLLAYLNLQTGGFLSFTVKNALLLIPGVIVIFPIALTLMVYEPKAKSVKRKREIDRDVLFAGRHLWISVKGGLPLFDSLVAISKSNYGLVSKEINRIVEKVFVGVPLDAAMQEVVENNPSPSFRRMMIQIVNSVRSGADVGESLGVVLDQISREQLIDVKEYGQRLNPLVMFYMILGVIFPSLGISVGILILSFSGISLKLNDILLLIPVIGFVQYLFLSYIDVSRPSYEV